MKKYKIGISLGDINGIGPEIILKALDHKEVLRHMTPIIYGSGKVLAYHKNMVKNINTSFINAKDVENVSFSKVNVINCADNEVQISLGKPTEASGKFAIDTLTKLADDAKSGKLDAIVTAPINKHAMQLAGWKFPGHTEFFGSVFDVKDQLMFMVSDSLKIATATGHTPLVDVASKITKENIRAKIQLLHSSLKVDFGIEKPVIGVLGLNPHAGDEGSIGKEEVDLLKPLIVELKKSGLLVSGPYPADGFFGSNQFGKVDGILAMYHDQGLIPFKALTFNAGVNFTAGLPIVRTSPDHGTAYNLAGKNLANPKSFRQALFTALDITRRRMDYKEANANPLKNKPKQTARFEE